MGQLPSPDATVRESRSPFISGRWRERRCRRVGHLRHPANPVHPVSCRSMTGRNACSNPRLGAEKQETRWQDGQDEQDGATAPTAPRATNRELKEGNGRSGRHRPCEHLPSCSLVCGPGAGSRPSPQRISLIPSSPHPFPPVVLDAGSATPGPWREVSVSAARFCEICGIGAICVWFSRNVAVERQLRPRIPRFARNANHAPWRRAGGRHSLRIFSPRSRGYADSTLLVRRATRQRR